MALGGTAVAAVSSTAPPNSVDTAALRNGAVTNSKLHADAVTSAKVKNGSLKKVDFAAGQIPAGPAGPPGPPGAAGAQGPKGDKGDKGDPGNNALVAYANVNGTSGPPSIRSFGGQGTTAASVASCGTGCFDVTFTGSYPGATSKDKIASFATADTDTYDWASTSLNSSPVPSTSSITIRVFTISGASSPATLVSRDFAVEVLVQ